MQSGVVESFAFHAALISIAIILGYVIKWVLSFLVDGLPLFPMAMLGGSGLRIYWLASPI